MFFLRYIVKKLSIMHTSDGNAAHALCTTSKILALLFICPGMKKV